MYQRVINIALLKLQHKATSPKSKPLAESVFDIIRIVKHTIEN